MPKDRKITRENRKKGLNEDNMNPIRNPEHYLDLTAHYAIAMADKREKTGRKPIR
jgi:hypothetical protein